MTILVRYDGAARSFEQPFYLANQLHAMLHRTRRVHGHLDSLHVYRQLLKSLCHINDFRGNCACFGHILRFVLQYVRVFPDRDATAGG